MRRFARTPYYTGPNDPERGEVRGPLQLGETVVIESIGGHDQNIGISGELKPGMVHIIGTPRYSRPGGPFLIEGIEPGDWVAIHILNIEVGPYGFYRNGGPHWGSIRQIAPVRDGLVHFPPDFVVPERPMIGFISLQETDAHRGALDAGGNMDFNSVCPGSILHLRAQKPGGLLYLCDVHARMGDGELTGTGVEIDADVTLRLERSPGFPTCSPVVETTTVNESAAEWLTSGQGANWEDALKIAWSDMVALLCDRYETTAENANLIVGTIADARPGYAAGTLNQRGYGGSGYVTCQLAVTKDLRRTGQPYRA